MKILILLITLLTSFSHLDAQKKVKENVEKTEVELKSDDLPEPGPPPELVDEEGYSKILEIKGTLKYKKIQTNRKSVTAYLETEYRIVKAKTKEIYFLHPTKKVSKKMLKSFVDQKVFLKCNYKVEQPNPQEQAPMEYDPVHKKSQVMPRKFCEVLEIEGL